MSNPCRFVWHDLSTSDVEAAKSFYTGLFGWQFEGSVNAPYHHIRAGEQMIGGLRGKDANEPGPSSWLGYVLVDDVAAAAERSASSGGRTYMPTYVSCERRGRPKMLVPIGDAYGTVRIWYGQNTNLMDSENNYHT